MNTNETLATSQSNENAQTTNENVNRVKVQKSVTKMTNVKEFLSGESSTIHSFDLANFPKGIGQMLNKVEGKAEFTFLGKKFTVKALTATNSNPERAADIYRQLVANLFPANMERFEVIAANSEAGKVLTTLKGSGFKFKTLCKVEVSEAIALKVKNWKAKINAHKEIVRGLNGDTIAETKVLTESTKQLKAANLAYITGFEKKYFKKYDIKQIADK